MTPRLKLSPLAVVSINGHNGAYDSVGNWPKTGVVNKNDTSWAGLGLETDWPNLSTNTHGQMVAYGEFSFHVNRRDIVSFFYPLAIVEKRKIPTIISHVLRSIVFSTRG